MKTNRSRWIWLLLALPFIGLAGCSLDVYGRPGAYYHQGYNYYPDGSRYLYPHRVYEPREHARIIVRPDGHRDYVYER